MKQEIEQITFTIIDKYFLNKFSQNNEISAKL